MNKFTKWSAHTRHTPILSWFARTKGGLVSWRGIAQGHAGRLDHQAGALLKASGWDGYFCFHKEPEDEGTPENWKAAYSRVHKIFHNVGVTKMRWVVCLMASTYAAGERGAVAARELRHAGCGRLQPIQLPQHPVAAVQGDLLPGARVRAGPTKRSLYVVEAGCVEGEPGRKADWFKGARATIKTWPRSCRLLLQQRGHRLHLLRGFLVVRAVVVPRDGSGRLLPVTVRALVGGAASPPPPLVDAGTGLP